MASRLMRTLVWLLGAVSSRDAAGAVVGDLEEELTERRAAGHSPKAPRLWLAWRIAAAIGATVIDGAPRSLRALGLTIRDAVRAIRATPAHSTFIVLVLAVGVTLGTVTFSVVDAVVLRPLPLDHPERIVTIPMRDDTRKTRIAQEDFWRLHDNMATTDSVAVWSTTIGAMVTANGVTDEMSVRRSTADLFRVLRLSAGIGRLWTSEEEANGDTHVAVLGYRFWRQRFGGDESVLGKSIAIDNGPSPFTVIGVLSAESDHPETDITNVPVWVPERVPRVSSEGYFGGVIARVRPSVTPSQVADDVRRLTSSDWHPDVTPLINGFIAPVQSWMMLALAAAGMVVLVACANAANLMLTRSSARAQEMAIRASLGASGRRVAASVLVEGVILSCAATAAGLGLSIAGVALATRALTSTMPYLFRLSTVALNGRVLMAAIVSAIVTSLAFSLVPASHTARAPIATLLKDGAAPPVSGQRRWRSVFLTAEVATVVVLLVVSWLFIVSLIHVIGIDLGIDRTNLLAVSSRTSFQTTVRDVRQRIESLPGVSGVAVSAGGASLPLVGRAFGGAWATTMLQRTDAGDGSAPLETLEYRVTPNYFEVSGLHFRRGGTWADDPVNVPPVVVLDEKAASQMFGSADPIGQQVRATQPAGVFTVIGTVPHVYARGPEDPDAPSAYFAIKPNPARNFAGLFVKTTRPPEQMRDLITEVLKPVAPPLKEPYVFIADDAVTRITASRRFNAELMSIFGVAGMLIGAAGVYAVMASFVTLQTRDIGVRLALGATPGRIERGVLALAWRHVVMGLAIGVPVAWWLSRGFTSLLFHVTPADASVYAVVAAVTTAAGLLAAWLPARRASKIDPIVSLRS